MAIIEKAGGANLDAVQHHVAVSTLKMEDANRAGNSVYTRFDSAYDAIIRCALAVLEISGMKVSTDFGHHRVMVDFLSENLGFEPQRVNALRLITRDRNANVYGGDRPTTEMEVREVIALAVKVRADTEVWLR